MAEKQRSRERETMIVLWITDRFLPMGWGCWIKSDQNVQRDEEDDHEKNGKKWKNRENEEEKNSFQTTKRIGNSWIFRVEIRKSLWQNESRPRGFQSNRPSSCSSVTKTWWDWPCEPHEKQSNEPRSRAATILIRQNIFFFFLWFSFTFSQMRLFFFFVVSESSWSSWSSVSFHYQVFVSSIWSSDWFQCGYHGDERLTLGDGGACSLTSLDFISIQLDNIEWICPPYEKLCEEETERKKSRLFYRKK